MDLSGIEIINEGMVPFDTIRKILERPVVKPRYRINMLTPTEEVAYTIPETDIPIGGIDYTESYQNGQRRNISLTLANGTGKYTPGVNSIWVNTRMSLDIGIQYGDQIIWFPKGIYVVGDVSVTRGVSASEVSVQLQDKYAVFEGKTGTLEDAYEVEVGSTITDVVKGLMNTPLGNGYLLDYKEPVFDVSFLGMKTQATIRAEEGGNLGQIISELATQLSAEYYYNEYGNLCFYPVNDTVDDSAKPVIWSYKSWGRDLHNMSLNYDNENIVNCVKVVGDSIDSDLFMATVKNENPGSPICVQRIGKRMDAPYTSSSVWSDLMAEDLAKYYLRKASIAAITFPVSVSYNPALTVNKLVEVEDDFLEMNREKLLITSISFNSEGGQMSLNLCNTADLPITMKRR